MNPPGNENERSVTGAAAVVGTPRQQMQTACRPAGGGVSRSPPRSLHLLHGGSIRQANSLAVVELEAFGVTIPPMDDFRASDPCHAHPPRLHDWSLDAQRGRIPRVAREFPNRTPGRCPHVPRLEAYPHFSSTALAAALAAAGIAYRHEPDLGGRRRARGESPNAFWKNASFRAYADHMATPEFRAALDRLIADAARESTAIMCAEAVPWRCHRWLISDALVARGREVIHILGHDSTKTHELNASACLSPDGTLTYPADTTQSGGQTLLW